MTDNFVIKDSGKREDFDSGMTRDTTGGKIEYHRLYHGVLVERLCSHLTKGAQKYPDNADGTPNWMLANSEKELIRFRKSAARHFAQWMMGRRDEDHFAATVFNMNAWEWLRAKLEAENHRPRRKSR